MALTKIIPPTPDYNYFLGEIKNDNFAENQPAVIVVFGIGESGQRLNLQYSGHDYKYTAQGSQEATQVVLNRAKGFASTATNQADIVSAADAMKFNIVTFSIKHEGENKEVQIAIKYAKEVLKASKILILTNSLGGYTLQKQADADPTLFSLVDGVIWLVPGPGHMPNTAKNIAASGVQNWFLVVENDIQNGTNPSVGVILHKEILALGGNSYLTVYKTGQWTDKDAHNLYYRVIPAWFKDKLPGNTNLGGLTSGSYKTINIISYSDKGQIITDTTIPNVITDPKISIYDFLLNAAKTNPITPAKTIAEQTPIPVPDPIPTPPDAPIYIAGVQTQGDDKIVARSIIDVVWNDNTDPSLRTKDRFSSTGPFNFGRLQGAWSYIEGGKQVVYLSYLDQKTVVKIGPKKGDIQITTN